MPSAIKTNMRRSEIKRDKNNASKHAVGRWILLNSSTGTCIAKYTLLFLAVALIAFAPLLIWNRSFINSVDGLPAQFRIFVNTGQVMRATLDGFVCGEGLAIPFYNLSEGYGAPLSWYFDPFYWLSVCIPSEYSELAFNIIVVCRLWLSGIAIFPLARAIGINHNWSIVSALTYVFGSSGLNSFLQVQYINHMILFPILVWGALLLTRESKPWVFIVASAAICMICGLYILYIMLLLLAVFIIVQFVVNREDPKTWCKTFAIFIGCIIAALLASAPTTIPTIQSLISLDRLGVDYYKPALYSSMYYQQMIAGFLQMRFGERDWFFGYGALALVCCIMLFGKTNDYRIKIARNLLVIGTVFLCVPFFGSLFNGFSYVANRWVFGFALLVACIVGLSGQNQMFNASSQKLIATALVLATYTMLMALLPEARGKSAWLQLGLAWAILILATWPIVAKRHLNRVLNATSIKFLTTVIALLALGLNTFLFLSPYGANWQSRLLHQGEAYDRVATQTAAAMAASAESNEGLYRYDRSIGLYNSVMTPGLSSSGVFNVYGIDFYNNLYNNSVDRFHGELALAGSAIPSVYTSLDQRAGLMQILGVKFWIGWDDEKIAKPYGIFDDKIGSLEAANGRAMNIYEINDASPMAIIFESAISKDAYDALSPLERQEALLQGVVLEDAANNQVSPHLTSKSVDFTVAATEGRISIDSGVINVRESGASIVLSVSPAAHNEVYLYVDGFEFRPLRPRQQYTNDEWKALSDAERQEIESAETTWSEPSTVRVEVESDYSDGAISIETKYSHLAGGKDEWLWNVGYSDTGTSTIVLTFKQPGVYSFDKFDVLAQPMDTLEDAKRSAAKTEIRNLTYSHDMISCDVSANAGQYLFLSVPYSDGWSAIVNGEPCEIMKADTAFMAIHLPDGECHVALTYSSPMPLYFAIGIAMCGCLVGAYVVVRKGSRRKDPVNSILDRDRGGNPAPKRDRKDAACTAPSRDGSR